MIVTKGSSADIDLVNGLKLAGITNPKIEYANNETARLVARGGPPGPFAYGGGEGSIQDLVKHVRGLTLAWMHCPMLDNGQETSEPFSFVVRSASAGLIDAVNHYIAHPTAPYPGGRGSGLGCSPLKQNLDLAIKLVDVAHAPCSAWRITRWRAESRGPDAEPSADSPLHGALTTVVLR